MVSKTESPPRVSQSLLTPWELHAPKAVRSTQGLVFANTPEIVSSCFTHKEVMHEDVSPGEEWGTGEALALFRARIP